MPNITGRLVRESDVDVLIVGAGPAGLMCANALAKAGVNVRIIDQRSTRVAAGQADGIQSRTIEVFQSYGLAERLLKEGNQIHMAAYYNPSSEGGGIELTERVPGVASSGARYPFKVALNQAAIESIFLDSMLSVGGRVERPTIPCSIEISADEAVVDDPAAHAVRVTLKNLSPAPGQANTEIINAKFVVGADGAHSWVRKAFNIDMEGEQTDYVWGVVDMVPDTDFPDIRNWSAVHSLNGSCMVIPREEDKVRLYIQLDGDAFIDATSGRISDKTDIGPLQLLEVARKSFSPYTFKDPAEFDWWTIYIIGQRVASKYSINERVFIAGDACHTHSPKAGQGMNASMNDTHNLAWKLTHVLRGWADISLLKTYELERRQYAQDLINFDKHLAKVFSGKPSSETNVDGVSHEEFLKAIQTFGEFSSGIGVHYPPSPIVQTSNQSYAKNIVVGQRMPPQILKRAADLRPYELQDLLPSDMRFKILIFTGNTSDVPRQSTLQSLAHDMEKLLCKYADQGKIHDLFEIIIISSATETKVRYTDVPQFFRPHWSKVFIEGTVVDRGHGAYPAFGIDPSEGAILVVRPDGYVGKVAPLDFVGDLDTYFASFMSPARGRRKPYVRPPNQ